MTLKLKQISYFFVATFLVFQGLFAPVGTQVLSSLGAQNSQIAYAQVSGSIIPVYEPKNIERGIHKWGGTGESNDGPLEVPSDQDKFCGEDQLCFANTGNSVTYLIEANLDGKDTKDFSPNNPIGFEINDHKPQGICELTYEDSTFVEQETLDASCDTDDFTITFNMGLQDSENRPLIKSDAFGTLAAPSVVAEGLTNGNGCEQDKIYGNNAGGNLRVWYLTRNGQSKEFSFNGTDWEQMPLGAVNSPVSANAVGGNHTLTKRCVGRNAIFPGNDSQISCDGGAPVTVSNYPVIIDLEVDDGGAIHAILQDPGANAKKCTIDAGGAVSNCVDVSPSDRLYINDGGSAQTTQLYQFYDHFGHTIQQNAACALNSQVQSSLYPTITEPARSVGIGNELPDGQKFILRNNSTDGRLYIYPGVTASVGGVTYKISGQVKKGFVLGGIKSPNLDQVFSKAFIYDNADCSGSPLNTINTLDPDYTNLIDDNDEDKNIKGEKDYCIEFEYIQGAIEPQSIAVYQNRLNYYATLFGKIDEEYEDHILVNSISNDNLGVGNHAFLFGTGDTTFKIEKELKSGFEEDGHEVGDEVKFQLTITAEGDTSTKPLYIQDILSGEKILSWDGDSVSDVVTVETPDACSLEDNQQDIEEGKLLIKLKHGIESGDDNKCVLTLNALFTGYGCFSNNSLVVKGSYPTNQLDEENPEQPLIPLENGSGVTVCSSGFQNLILEKYLLKEPVSDYQSVSASISGGFYAGDPFIFVVKYRLSGDNNFVLNDVKLKDYWNGFGSAQTFEIEVQGGASRDGGAITLPSELHGGDEGYILIKGNLMSGAEDKFYNAVKLVDGPIEKTASATGAYSGVQNTSGTCVITAQVQQASGGGSGSTGGSSSSQTISFNCGQLNPAISSSSTIDFKVGANGVNVTKSSTDNSFQGILSGIDLGGGNPAAGSNQSLEVKCEYSGSDGKFGSCSTTVVVSGTQMSSPDGGGGGGNPPPSGNSPNPNGNSSPPKGQCKGGGCKPKECQASNFAPGSTVPYKAGIVNNDPEVAMEGITFWDDLPPGMSMYEWTASVNGQIVKQGNKNGAKGHVDFTQDLQGVVLQPGESLDMYMITKVDDGYNFGQFVNPGANLFECDDDGNQIPTSGSNNNNNPNPNGNSSQPGNKCGGGASNAPSSFPDQFSPLPSRGTGSGAGVASTGGAVLQCVPKYYDINVTKKILSDKIEVGKSLKFEVTIKNEGLRTVTGLIIKEAFSGIVIKPPFVVTSSGSASGGNNASNFGIIQGYFSTASSGEFALMSGGTLTSGQSITVVIDSILSGTSFSNMVQACNYKDDLDPDSDACNGYDKGEDDSAVVSGSVNAASLGDRIWFDADANGIQNTGEKGISDLMVTLITCNTDVVLMSGKTNSDGMYGFTNVVPGSYQVRIDVSALKGFTLTPSNVGTDDSADSDGKNVDGKYVYSECIALSGGINTLNHDLGLTIDYSKLTGLSFLGLSKTLISTGNLAAGAKLLFKISVTNDGIMGLTGVSVKDKWIGLSNISVGTSVDNLRLIGSGTNDRLIWTGITLGGKAGGSGSINCTGGVSCPETFGPTGNNEFVIYVEGTMTGSSFSNYAQLCDYDANMQGPRPPLAMNKPCDNSINQADDDLVSGAVSLGMLGDLVWNDLNGDGLQTTGEAGVANIDVELYTCVNTSVALKKTKTSTNGTYKFDSLNPGGYQIKVLLNSPNDKYAFSSFEQGSNSNIDSDVKTISGNAGLTDCIAVAMGTNNNSVDFGLVSKNIDLEVTKNALKQYVTSGDMAIFTIVIKNVGSGTIKKYNLHDALPSSVSLSGLNATERISLSYWMSGSSTGASDSLQSVCGFPAGGWSTTYGFASGSGLPLPGQMAPYAISGFIPNANILPGQSCVYTVKARVVSSNIGPSVNVVTIKEVNDETTIFNNTASAQIFALPVCDLITLNTDVGDNPFEFSYLINSTGGVVRLLDSLQNTIKTYNSLSGKDTITSIGNYYLEYATGANGPKCVRPIVVKELSECVSLSTTQVNDTQFSLSCVGNYATGYRIEVYQGSGANKSILTTINSASGTVTLSGAGEYTAQCFVNGSISYALDKLGAMTTPITSQFQCPYKQRSDGKMCAVDTLVGPMKSSFDPAKIASLGDPIEYCTSAEASNAACINGLVGSTLVKNPNSCTKPLAIYLPDLLVTKSADKGFYGTGETIVYTLTVKNIGSGLAKTLAISDEMPRLLRLDAVSGLSGLMAVQTGASTIKYIWSMTSTNLQPGQELVAKVTTKVLDASPEFIKNTVAVATSGAEVLLSNNTAEYSISKQGNANVGDFVWLDGNRNGVQDINETGVKNIQVQLVSCTSLSPLFVTFTDINGKYNFPGVGGGNYRILVQLPDTYRVSPRNVGMNDKDSNIDPMTNLSDCFTVTAGQIRTDIDAGLFIDPTIPPQNQYCGNKQIEPQYGEQCDGNTVTDGVCQNCQIIKNSVSICGDGILQAGETCDVNLPVPAGAVCYQCRIQTGSVCGDGKVDGYEECDINTPTKAGNQCIGCIWVSNSLATCGNGNVELGEACDLGSANGSNTNIPSGVYAGKKCSTNCNVVNTIGNVVLSYEPPSCTELDPPSVMQGEYLPFRWDLDDSNVVTTCTKPGQVLRDTMRCHFDLYAGKGGTTSVVKSLETSCYSPASLDGALFSQFNALSADKYGRFQLQLGTDIIKSYGEYKLRLKRIDYRVCAGTGDTTNPGSVYPQNTFNDSYDETICEYNFTVSRPYLMQVGSLLSSNASDGLYNFYGFASNAGTQNILQQYGVQLNAVGLSQYIASSNLNYLVDNFVDKYNKLAVQYLQMGTNATKVAGREIYVFNGDYSYDESKYDLNKPKTIIVNNGNLKIIGDVRGNTLFIVPNGNIIISSSDCSRAQTINGVYITKGNIQSDTNYINNNVLNNWCDGGNLIVRGVLIGNGLNDLVDKRRSVLNDWFVNNKKKDAILNGASVLIRSNDSLFTNPAPGLDEFTKELNTFKR